MGFSFFFGFPYICKRYASLSCLFVVPSFDVAGVFVLPHNGLSFRGDFFFFFGAIPIASAKNLTFWKIRKQGVLLFHFLRVEVLRVSIARLGSSSPWDSLSRSLCTGV